MKFKSKILVTTVVFAMVFSGNIMAQGSQESGNTDQNKGPVEINFYDWTGYEDVVEAFNATHDNIHVNEHVLPASNYETKLLTMLSGRAEIDCFMEKRPQDVFSQFKNGYIASLNNLIEATGAPNNAVEAYKNTCSIGDDIVVMPFRGGATYTYYNKKIFEKFNIPTPDTFVEKGEWTWENFEKLAETIHNADNAYVGASIYFWPTYTLFMAGQENNPILDSDGKLYDVTPLLNQISLRKKMEDNGSMWSLIDMKTTKTNYSKQFGDGHLAMLIIGEWLPGTLLKLKDEGLMKGFTMADVGITRLPCDVTPYTTCGISVGNCITSYSKKQQASFEFLEWYSGPDGAMALAKSGALPAISNNDVKQEFSKIIGDPKSLNYYLEDKANFNANFSPYGSRVESVIDELQERYLLGNITDNQFVELFKIKIQDILETTF